MVGSTSLLSYQTFQGLLATGSELIFIPGDLKYHCGPLVKLGAFRSQVVNEAFFQSVSNEPMGLSRTAVVFPVLELIVVSHVQPLSEPHMDSVAHEVEAIAVGEATWKPPELALPMKIVHQSRTAFLVGSQRLVRPPSTGTTEGWVVRPQYLHPTHLLGLRRKRMGAGE